MPISGHPTIHRTLPYNGGGLYLEYITMKPTQLYYRVQQEDSTQGLWYNRDGTFNNRIVTSEFDYLGAKDVPMGFDEEVAGGWLSAVKDMKSLYNWFTKAELVKLQEQGLYVFEFKVEQAKFYEPYQHDLIHAETSVITDKLEVLQ